MDRTFLCLLAFLSLFWAFPMASRCASGEEKLSPALKEIYRKSMDFVSVEVILRESPQDELLSRLSSLGLRIASHKGRNLRGLIRACDLKNLVELPVVKKIRDAKRGEIMDPQLEKKLGAPDKLTYMRCQERGIYDEEVEVIIMVGGVNDRQMGSVGFKLSSSHGNILSGRIPFNRLADLANLAQVIRIEFSAPVLFPTTPSPGPRGSSPK